ncbi:hypothetical protein BJ742DRAFT_832764 [Cladochytrium replicatum]|nr:hypothetical protein BJ742DRAFT_832764 [Cladochytrium replicatum]
MSWYVQALAWSHCGRLLWFTLSLCRADWYAHVASFVLGASEDETDQLPSMHSFTGSSIVRNVAPFKKESPAAVMNSSNHHHHSKYGGRTT